MSQTHEEHRKRLRQRFLDEGLEGFTEIQALELMLFYCIPRRDTNELAHRLLERFGGLPQVLEAKAEDLCKVDGIGEGAATYLKLLPAFGAYYGIQRAKMSKKLDTLDECGQYLLPYFFGKSTETVYLLCLDAKRKVLGCPWIGEGSVNSASVPIRKIVETALALNATSVVLAHNHPSGVAMPSKEDVSTTKLLAATLAAVEVMLADHVVVADDDYVSLVQSGLLNPSDYF